MIKKLNDENKGLIDQLADQTQEIRALEKTISDLKANQLKLEKSERTHETTQKQIEIYKGNILQLEYLTSDRKNQCQVKRG